MFRGLHQYPTVTMRGVDLDQLIRGRMCGRRRLRVAGSAVTI